jgi:RNA polymerase sigma-70 factor (ECF subfamily)
MDFDALDDAALLRALASQPEAFAALYRRYERPVLGYMVRRTKRPDLAADLTAETFAAALAALRAERGPRETFEPWLFGIARNKLFESFRRGFAEDDARRKLSMEPVALDDEQLAAIEALGDDTRVQQLVARLPASQREAVIARVLDERDYADIAASLELSELIIRKRVSRGLASLRARLEGNAS